MSADLDVLRPVRCCLCSWLTNEQDPAAREQAWLAHYYGVHPQPLVTRCTVPPYCGWSTTAPDLSTLRRLHREHEATHTDASPKKPASSRRRSR